MTVRVEARERRQRPGERVEVPADVAGRGVGGRESARWKRLMELMVVAQRRKWERETISDSEGSRD